MLKSEHDAMKLANVCEDYYLMFTTDYAVTRGHHFCSKIAPERGLLCAIILRALQDLRHTARGSPEWLSAQYFFEDASENDTEYFSFRFCCAQLDLNADMMLRAINELTENSFDTQEKRAEELNRAKAYPPTNSPRAA